MLVIIASLALEYLDLTTTQPEQSVLVDSSVHSAPTLLLLVPRGSSLLIKEIREKKTALLVLLDASVILLVSRLGLLVFAILVLFAPEGPSSPDHSTSRLVEFVALVFIVPKDHSRRNFVQTGHTIQMKGLLHVLTVLLDFIVRLLVFLCTWTALLECFVQEILLCLFFVRSRHSVRIFDL